MSVKANDLIIRPARRDEVNFLVPLINRAGEGILLAICAQMAEPGEDPWVVARARVESDDSPLSYRFAWIAEASGLPAGCLIVRQVPAAPRPIDPTLPSLLVPLIELENLAPNTCYINVVSVVEKMRGLGIGTHLLDFAESFSGPSGMSLIVADHNAGARRLYRRCGYQEISRRVMVKDGWDSPGEEWLLKIKSSAN